MRRGVMWRWIAGTAGVLLIFLAASLYFPWLLMFPYKSGTGGATVYSERPIGPRMAAILARSEGLLKQSPLDAPLPGRRIYLTSGGWRWRFLALSSSDSFALTRPFSQNVVVNNADVDADRVTNGRSVGGVRSISGLIAHETTHILIGRRYGAAQARLFPAWKVEGYADHVAQESSLSEDDVAQLKASGASHKALIYYDGRKRVEAELASGKTVDQLFLGGG